jgi:hypothetical protein
MKATNIGLTRYFKEFNRKYFGNKLDSNIKVTFGKIQPLGLTKQIWFSRPATTKERRENKLNKTATAHYYIPRIYISERLKWAPRLAITTLFHEMVHAEDMKRSSCGPNWNRFNRRMVKLAKDGAFNGWW